MKEIDEKLLLDTFPTIDKKRIKRILKYNLNLENIKCLGKDCNNPRSINSNNQFQLFCSKECRIKNKDILIGYQNDARKKANFENSGYYFPSQNPATKQLIKERVFKKFGVYNVSQSTDIKKLKIMTTQLKHGVDDWNSKHLLNYDDWSNYDFWMKNFLTKNNLLDKYKVMDYFNCGEARVYQKAKKLGIEYSKFSGTSLQEQAIIPYLEDLGLMIETNVRNIIGNQELDIWLPELNLAIEYNGSYWHSTEYKDKAYHQTKSLKCIEKSIRLLHLYPGMDIENSINAFLLYEPSVESEYDLDSGCYPLGINYKVLEPELLAIDGFNIWNAGKIKNLKE